MPKYNYENRIYIGQAVFEISVHKRADKQYQYIDPDDIHTLRGKISANSIKHIRHYFFKY